MEKKIKLSDYVAQFLSQISDFAFVGHGSSVVHLLDSIDKRKDIKNISSQNEQGASLAADAYSRSSGKIGVSIATSGPGIINLLQGIGCSYFDSIPQFVISGAVPTNNMRDNKKIRQVGFQEMEVVDIVKPLTKYAVLLKKASHIKYELEKMLFICKTGRPGPVLLDIPDDLQREFIDPNKLKSYGGDKILKNSEISTKKINQFYQLINTSKRPVIIIGNGSKNYKKEISSFIKQTNIPYLLTWATFDMFDHKDKLCIGTFGVAATRYGNFSVQSSDLIISFGSRLSYQLTGSNKKTFAPLAKKIIIDIDKYEIKKKHSVNIDLSFNNDIGYFLSKINNKYIKNSINKNNEWINFTKSLKKKYPIVKDEYFKQKKYVNPYVFFNVFSSISKKSDILIPDASANLIWAYQSLVPKMGQQIFTALNHSPMGYSIAASVGAKLYQNKNKLKGNVSAFIGDGSVAMNVQELETIAFNNLNVKIFIFNNNGYGLIKGTLELFLNKNYVGVDPSSGLSIQDFKKMAYSYNIPYIKIDNHKNLEKKLKRIQNSKSPIICDLIVNPNQKVIPKLSSGNPIHLMSPLLDNLKIDEAMKYTK